MPKPVSELLEFKDEGPVTKKVIKTDRTIMTLVCLKPSHPFAQPGEAGRQILQKSGRSQIAVLELLGIFQYSPGGPGEIANRVQDFCLEPPQAYQGQPEGDHG